MVAIMRLRKMKRMVGVNQVFIDDWMVVISGAADSSICRNGNGGEE